jgi:lysophospholipase L1-like esterase
MSICITKSKVYRLPFHLTRFLRYAVCILFVIATGANCVSTDKNDDNQIGNFKPKKIARNTAITYLAIGDSTCIGLGARNFGGYVDRLTNKIRDVNKNLQMIRLCAAGATTADVLKMHESNPKTSSPLIITINIGLNDLIQRVDLADFSRNYERLISILNDKDVYIITSNLPDIALIPAASFFKTEDTAKRLADFNNSIKEIAERNELPMVDLHQISRQAVSQKELFSADGLHPSDAGYELWAQAMWLEVKEVIE